jgi:serine phosphatase RsbU (regulator of sigma subunit)
MNILVVDAEAEIRLLFFSASDEIGCEVYFAASATEALQILNAEHSIGIAVLAYNAGTFEGIELAKKIRDEFSSRHIPILFLSDTGDTHALVTLLDHGDDVVIKPFSQPVLLAKLLAHRRTRALYQQIETQLEQLELYRAQIDMEHHIAADVFARISSKTLPSTPGIYTFASPYSSFNGDLALVMARPGEGFNVLIADITGHGLPAALGTMPVADIFFAMTQRGFNISDIAREINRVFRARMPDYLLCAAALISVIDNGQRMQIWTGGIPPLLVLNARGEIKTALPARHMALGALADAEFDDRSEALLLTRGDQLICYTDGITETTSADGEMFGEERLLATLANSDKQGAALIDHLMSALFQHAGGGWLNDDATVFCFDTIAYQGLSDFGNRGVENTYAEWDGFEWQTRMKFDNAQLRVESPLDMMLNSFPPNPMILAARADLSVIINELFVNALDHGLLKLDSALKEGEDGMLNYYGAREAALAAMDSGHIAFALHCKINKGIAEFALSFEDSGSGFNIDEVLTRSPNGSQYSGRGLRMVAAMCDEIISNSSGNTISLRYCWPAQH